MTDVDFLREAYRAAADLGTDPSTQNGAVLVRDGKIVLAAGNRFPAGVAETPERWQRPLKYKYVVHAEAGVIILAALQGVQTYGLTMYCPWFACCACSQAIIQAGIREVVGHDFPPRRESAHWLEEIALADGMLREAGVTFRRVPGAVGGVKIRFNGKAAEP